MDPAVVDVGSEYVLNHAAALFARSARHGRHDFALAAGPPETPGGSDPTANVRDAWRLPIVDSAWGNRASTHNHVTFLLDTRWIETQPKRSVALACTATELWQPVPMLPLADGPVWTVTLAVPFAQVHFYRFEVDDRPVVDPVNPQRVSPRPDESWSRFFTWYCTERLSFERREFALLTRLVRHLLPLNDDESRDYLSREGRAPGLLHLHRLDVDVGVANFIDKLVAREERHHLSTYRISLALIDRVLRVRNPYDDIERMPEEMFVELYTDLALTADHQFDSSLGRSGWDFGRYGSPRHFFTVLRRHVWTGTFAHPRYGGNSGGMSWCYLHDRFSRDGPGFAWDRSIEAPLGSALDGYRG